MQITKSIKLDFACQPFLPVVYAKQGDVNSRFLEVIPLNNGCPYIIPDGVVAKFACKKPDGHHVFNECPSIVNNSIIVPLTEQTLAVKGKALASITLFDNVKQSVLSTQNFILQIEVNPFVDADIESTDDYQVLTSAIIAAENASEQAVKGAEAAEKAADSATKAAKIANEAASDIGFITKDFPPVIEQVITGNVITVSDAAKRALRGLTVYGKTTQQTYSGKNICPESVFDNPNNNGSGFTYDASTRTITITADETINNGIYCAPCNNLVVGETYTVSFDIRGTAGKKVRCGWAYSQKTITLTEDYVRYSSAYVVTKTAEPISFYNYYSATSGLQLQTGEYMQFANVQIEPGDTASEYEPFVGGIPAPNPDYPQDLVSVGGDGSIEVYFAGDNLFDASSLSLGANTSLNIEDDGYKITVIGGTKQTYAASTYTIPIYLVRGKTVCLQVDNLTTTNPTASRSIVQPRIKKADGTTSYPTSVTTTGYKRIITIPPDAQAFSVAIMTNNSSTKLESDCTMVVEGLRVSLLEDAPWKSYSGQTLTIPTPNGLPGIPVTSGGNYTDTSGQQWVCNEIDFARGVYVQRVYREHFATVVAISSQTGTYTKFLVNPSKKSVNFNNNQGSPCWSNKFTPFSGTYASMNNYGGKCMTYAGSDRIAITFTDSSIITVDAANAALGEDGFDTIYILAEPIETPLDTDTLNAFAILHTNFPNTTITNDEGAEISVKYVADTKTYIDNKFNELAAAIINNA